MQELIQSRTPFQSKGRNGYFWPVAYTITSLETQDCCFVEIEGSKSIKGDAAPISIRLTHADARGLAKAILAETDRVMWKEKTA